MIGIQLYLCCPSLNNQCIKEGCFIHGGPCQCTSKQECARHDMYGDLIKANGEEYNQNGSELESKI